MPLQLELWPDMDYRGQFVVPTSGLISDFGPEVGRDRGSRGRGDSGSGEEARAGRKLPTVMSSTAFAEDAEMRLSAGSARPSRDHSREPSQSPSLAGSSLQTTSTVGRTESAMTVNSLSDFGSMLEPHADGFIRVSSGLYLHGSSATLQEHGFVKEGLDEIHDFKPLGFSLTCDAEVLVFSRACGMLSHM